MRICVEIIPEHYVYQASITIKCKESEKNQILAFVIDALNEAEAKQCPFGPGKSGRMQPWEVEVRGLFTRKGLWNVSKR